MKIFSPCWKDIAFYFFGMFWLFTEKINTEIRSYHIGGVAF